MKADRKASRSVGAEISIVVTTENPKGSHQAISLPVCVLRSPPSQEFSSRIETRVPEEMLTGPGSGKSPMKNGTVAATSPA